jgi:hypothetical protein
MINDKSSLQKFLQATFIINHDIDDNN